MSARPTLAEAKARLDVAALWRLLDLPGTPTKSCRCPFHEDRSASFSVYPGKRGDARWCCFAGCGQGGPVELLSLALNIGEREACKRLLEMAGGADGAGAELVRPARPQPALVAVPPARRLLLPVGMRAGDREELQSVATRRGLSFEGVALAAARGLLWFAAARGRPAWIVTDGARVNAQARRLDGLTWPHIGGAKSWTLPGSRAAWPIGAREADRFPFVALVEGAPDLLAACHFAVAEGREADTAAVAMLGAANAIPEDALLHLAHKRVKIYPHLDPAGMAAAIRWTQQLERVGCEVDAFRFDGLRRADGGAVGDLNDLACLDADCYHAEAAELAEVLPR